MLLCFIIILITCIFNYAINQFEWAAHWSVPIHTYSIYALYCFRSLVLYFWYSRKCGGRNPGSGPGTHLICIGGSKWIKLVEDYLKIISSLVSEIMFARVNGIMWEIFFLSFSLSLSFLYLARIGFFTDPKFNAKTLNFK